MLEQTKNEQNISPTKTTIKSSQTKIPIIAPKRMMKASASQESFLQSVSDYIYKPNLAGGIKLV